MCRPTLLRILLVTFFLGSLGVFGTATSEAHQESTATTASHPLVGTWIVDPETNDPTNPPSFDAFMADGTLVNIGSDGASVGSWAVTGPQSAMVTFLGVSADGSNTIFIIRINVMVDESGESFTGTHSVTIVGADGTILAMFQGGGAQGVRINPEPMESGGASLPGLTTWTPSPAEAATPTS